MKLKVSSGHAIAHAEHMIWLQEARGQAPKYVYPTKKHWKPHSAPNKE